MQDNKYTSFCNAETGTHPMIVSLNIPPPIPTIQLNTIIPSQSNFNLIPLIEPVNAKIIVPIISNKNTKSKFTKIVANNI